MKALSFDILFSGILKTSKLELKCPSCASAEVFYTCTPNCCFNHVCGACGTTFETATVAAGGRIPGVLPPDPPPEPGDPAAPCARCDSASVSRTPEGELVCVACGARLRLEITEVSPG